MPAAVIAAIISAASAATMGGLQMAGVGQPSPNEQRKLMEAQQAKADAASKATQQQQQQQAMRQQLPDLQAQLGGAVAPDYLMSAASSQAGAPGETNVARQALSQWLGLPSDSSTMGVPGLSSGLPGSMGGSSTGGSPTGSSPLQPQGTDYFPYSAVPAYGELSGGSP